MIPTNNVQIQGQGQVSADQLNTYVQTVDTAPMLRQFIGLPTMCVLLQGIADVADGLGGIFYWSQSATGPDDNLNVIVPPGASSGAWLRNGSVPSILFVNVAEAVVDGGGATPATGVFMDGYIPVSCTIKTWVLQADAAGDCVIDVWVAPFANNSPPTVSNSITASAKPTLSASQSMLSSTLTGWTTAIPAGSALRYNLVSVSGGITRVTLTLVATVP